MDSNATNYDPGATCDDGSCIPYFATAVSNKAGVVSGGGRSTTNYIKVEWWDGTANVYGSGAANFYVWSKGADAGSKTFRIYSSDANGNPSGSLTTLDCSSSGLTSLNVSGLTMLSTLICDDNSLTSLNVSGLTALNELRCNSNPITNLTVTGCSALELLVVNNHQLNELDVSNCENLYSLSLNGGVLTSLNLDNCGSLRNLDITANAFEYLPDFTGCPYLNSLSCNEMYSLAIVDVSGNQYLEELSCNSCGIAELYVDYCSSLRNLNCGNNPLDYLELTGCGNLAYLNCAGTPLYSLDVSGLVSLTGLYVTGNPYLAALDVSGLSALAELVCAQSAISSLNLNGCTALKYLDAASCALGGVSAVGVMFSSGLFDKKGRPKEVPTIYLNNNSMTGTDINNFFVTLSAVSPGSVVLDMRNNYGWTEDTGESPQVFVATNKGYVVLTS